MARIITHNLDEAAYLAVNGYVPRVRRTGPSASEISFELDEAGKRRRVEFWSGDAYVSLSKYLTARQAIKNETSRQAFAALNASRIEDRPGQSFLTQGTPYWYRVGPDVMHALYGNSDAHNRRLAEGNVYRTREDAELKRNPLRAI